MQKEETEKISSRSTLQYLSKYQQEKYIQNGERLVCRASTTTIDVYVQIKKMFFLLKKYIAKTKKISWQMKLIFISEFDEESNQIYFCNHTQWRKQNKCLVKTSKTTGFPLSSSDLSWLTTLKNNQAHRRWVSLATHEELWQIT